jgi:lambda repressor-like predicted transcriptional regulator
MNGTRWIVIAGAGLAAVVGGGVALGATGSSDPASDFLGDVANRLGVSKDKLEDAIDDAEIARIDRAVARGDLTKEQGEELKKRVRSGDGPVILPGFRGHKDGIGPLGPPEKGFFHGPGPVPGVGVDLIDEAADYLGMDADDVRKALRDGKSLADLAKDKGKSVDGLKQALRDAISKDAGRMADKLSDMVDELVEHGGGPIGPPGKGFSPGPLGPPPDKGFFPGPFPGFDLVDKAADYLGTDAADVRKALNDGKSLADLAKDKGKSVDGLEEVLRDAIRADVDKAVNSGDLTKEQGDRLAEKLSATVKELVERGRLEFHLRTHPAFAPA